MLDSILIEVTINLIQKWVSGRKSKNVIVIQVVYIHGDFILATCCIVLLLSKMCFPFNLWSQILIVLQMGKVDYE